MLRPLPNALSGSIWSSLHPHDSRAGQSCDLCTVTSMPMVNLTQCKLIKIRLLLLGPHQGRYLIEFILTNSTKGLNTNMHQALNRTWCAASAKHPHEHSYSDMSGYDLLLFPGFWMAEHSACNTVGLGAGLDVSAFSFTIIGPSISCCCKLWPFPHTYCTPSCHIK